MKFIAIYLIGMILSGVSLYLGYKNKRNYYIGLTIATGIIAGFINLVVFEGWYNILTLVYVYATYLFGYFGQQINLYMLITEAKKED